MNETWTDAAYNVPANLELFAAGRDCDEADDLLKKFLNI
jgi:hypothetical protein